MQKLVKKSLTDAVGAAKAASIATEVDKIIIGTSKKAREEMELYNPRSDSEDPDYEPDASDKSGSDVEIVSKPKSKRKRKPKRSKRAAKPPPFK